MSKVAAATPNYDFEKRCEELIAAIEDARRKLLATSHIHAYTWSQEVARDLEDALFSDRHRVSEGAL